MTRRRLAAAWAIGAAGYAVGLVVSTALDLPSGPVIVWMLVILSLAWYAILAPRFTAPATAPRATVTSAAPRSRAGGRRG
jgi:zinc/manganese transport system permease protein